MKRQRYRAQYDTQHAAACFPGFVFHWEWRDVFDYWAITRHHNARGARLALEYLAEKTLEQK